MSMFSRFLPSLLNAFTAHNPEPPVQPSHQPSPPAQELPAPDMVTTRRQSGAKVVTEFTSDGEAVVDGVNKDEVPAELLSPESRKRRREKVKEEEEVAAGEAGGKRMKKLPVRRKGAGDQEVGLKEGKTHWEKEMSVSEVLAEIPGEKAAHPGVEKVRKENEAPEPAAAVEDTTPKKTTSKSKAKATPTRSKPKPAPPVPSKTTPQPKHKKFSDDFSDDAILLASSATAVPGTEIQDSNDEEDSDDDAPEVVGKQDAQLGAREAAREAAKAAENLAATQRQKRQERDAQLKAQAADRKRKRGTEPSVKIDKSNIPLFLPSEYLDDDNPEDTLAEAEEASKRESKLAPGVKKMKFSQKIEKKPKDRIREDGAVLRVAEKKMHMLPPKADQNARAVKEAWLQGRHGGKAGGKAGPEKKRMGGGFFVR